jgi:hypothetical protein
VDLGNLLTNESKSRVHASKCLRQIKREETLTTKCTKKDVFAQITGGLGEDETRQSSLADQPGAAYVIVGGRMLVGVPGKVQDA